MTETDTFESGIGILQSESIAEKSPPFTVSGVALPVNTVVNGGRGVDHFFPESVLERAQGLLEGTKIVKNFHDLEGQAPADDVIGKVTSAGFQDGVGLVFEGEVSDEEIAEKIQHGFLDVSPSVARTLGDMNEQMGAREVENIGGFRDIAVVAEGQPGAEVNLGSNPAVTALSVYAMNNVTMSETDTYQENVEYSLSDAFDQDNFDTDEYTDAEWNASEVESQFPNPSDSEDARDELDRVYALNPEGEEARDNKSNWKAPFRTGPEAPANTRALVAIKAAVSGARGGFEDVDRSLLNNVEDRADAMLDEAPSELFGAGGEETDTESSGVVLTTDSNSETVRLIE